MCSDDGTEQIEHMYLGVGGNGSGDVLGIGGIDKGELQAHLAGDAAEHAAGACTCSHNHTSRYYCYMPLI